MRMLPMVELSVLPRLAQGLASAALQVDRELQAASAIGSGRC